MNEEGYRSEFENYRPHENTLKYVVNASSCLSCSRSSGSLARIISINTINTINTNIRELVYNNRVQRFATRVKCLSTQ